jgi:cyclopropane fatty-acyl-phospholipid synthase-like methyltransferase
MDLWSLLPQYAEELRTSKLFDLRSTVHSLTNSPAEQWVGLRPISTNITLIYAQIRTTEAKKDKLKAIEAFQYIVGNLYEGYFKQPRVQLAVRKWLLPMHGF